MKSNLFFGILFFGISCVSSLNAQVDRKPDYITSGYYQLVYEADIAHLERNDSLAYAKLQAAENACKLLNQPLHQEMELYAMYLLKNRNFSKAIYYMKKVADEYGKIPGLSLSVLGQDEQGNLIDSALTNAFLTEYPAFFDSIFPVIIQKSEAFYTPEKKLLIAELTDMTEKDQAVRKNWNTRRQQADSTKYFLEMKETDVQNANRFFEIIKKYGFPNTRKYGGRPQNNHLTAMNAMVLHISDYFDIEEMVLQYVRDGECDPSRYGTIIDRKAIITKKTEKCLYAAYTNTRDDQIADIEHLDERRLSIGMPTREMERKRNELIELKFQTNE